MLEGGGIYKITHTATGRIYVGSAIIFSRRWYDHRRTLRRGTHKNPHLQRAWLKYGEQAFAFDVLELVADPQALVGREQVWLDVLRPDFNLCPTAGNCFGRPRSPETRAKISRSQRGHLVSLEARTKIGDSSRGRVHGLETRAKVAASAQSRWDDPQYRARLVAKMRSSETREKMRVAHLGKTTPAEVRAKMSASHKVIPGKPCSPETRAKLSARVITPEWREKIRAAGSMRIGRPWTPAQRAGRERGAALRAELQVLPYSPDS